MRILIRSAHTNIGLSGFARALFTRRQSSPVLVPSQIPTARVLALARSRADEQVVSESLYPGIQITISSLSTVKPDTITDRNSRDHVVGRPSALGRGGSSHGPVPQASLDSREAQHDKLAQPNPPLANNGLYNSKGAPIAGTGLITSTATTSRQVSTCFAFVLVGKWAPFVRSPGL